MYSLTMREHSLPPSHSHFFMDIFLSAQLLFYYLLIGSGILRMDTVDFCPFSCEVSLSLRATVSPAGESGTQDCACLLLVPSSVAPQSSSHLDCPEQNLGVKECT